MKIYLVNANENWVIDRLVAEWYEDNPEISTHSPYDADIIWIISPWKWRELPFQLLASKKVVTTLHHIDPAKFNLNDFRGRDNITDIYHVPNRFTRDFIKQYTTKKIKVISYWGNDKLWFPLNKVECRHEFKLPSDKFLIGSFQRDTEGFDLKTPKLAKGPDIFCDMVEKYYKENENIEVILGGWRRQYIINRLKSNNIPYHYFDKPSFEVINKLYNCLDLYIVGSRHEGGPQAIIECALTKTPLISTNVGIAENILSPTSIFTLANKNAYPDPEHSFINVQKYIKSSWFTQYKNFFKEIMA